MVVILFYKIHLQEYFEYNDRLLEQLELMIAIFLILSNNYIIYIEVETGLKTDG